MGRSIPLSLVALSAITLCALLGGCTTAPETHAERSALVDESRAALTLMHGRDPQLKNFLKGSAGYAVFPTVGKGGLIVGGAFGRGTVYDAHGALVGYASVTQGSVGGVIGVRTSSLLLVFERPYELQSFQTGKDLQFGAEATAIAITEGCTANTRYHDGLAVFAMPRAGLMADASLNGQQFRFEKPVDMNSQPAPSRNGNVTSAQAHTE